MAVVRCPHGHYYDGVKFSSCPHCGISIEENSQAPSGKEPEKQQEVKAKGGLFGWFDRDKTVAVSSSEHTIALEQAADPEMEDDAKTIGFYSEVKGNDFVTGWLVCIEGPEKGRDYRLHHGFNRIGRDPGMQVQIADDPAITRKNHCSIVYDDKSNQFSLVPSAGAITYYKESLLTKAEVLQMGDLIEIGSSTLEFIPFCREGRVWKKEEND